MCSPIVQLAPIQNYYLNSVRRVTNFAHKLRLIVICIQYVLFSPNSSFLFTFLNQP